MNENEIQRIAAAAHALRPDWPISSLVTLLNRPEVVNRSRRDVAVALTWVACESSTKTPARVLEAGPWWIATNADGQRTGKSSYNIPCPFHADQIQPCRRCKAEAVPADHEQALTRVRAELASAKANTCGHGVDRSRGKCRDCEKPATPPPAPAGCKPTADYLAARGKTETAPTGESA